MLALTFGWPAVSRHRLLEAQVTPWLGVLSCGLGVALVLWSLVSFGRSFRVGIDRQQPNHLVTGGAFAVSRNPIYLAFGLTLLGNFLVFSTWATLVYVGGGAWVLHRQVRREEAHLREHYGSAFTEYCRRTRRYV